MRKLLVGFLWFLALYFGTCAVIGGIAGSMAASKLPKHTKQGRANQVAATAAMNTVLEVRVYVFTGALVIAALGSTFGYLPGTAAPALRPQRRSPLETDAQPVATVDAPVGLTHTADFHRRRSDPMQNDVT